jgi:hypothetical protein
VRGDGHYGVDLGVAMQNASSRRNRRVQGNHTHSLLQQFLVAHRFGVVGRDQAKLKSARHKKEKIL